MWWAITWTNVEWDPWCHIWHPITRPWGADVVFNSNSICTNMFCYQIFPCICFIQLTWRSRINFTDHDRYMPSFPIDQFWTWSGYISMLNFRPFLQCILKKIPRKPQILPPALSKWHQNEETHRPWSKSNQLYWCSGYTSMQNLRPFLLCVPKKISGNLSGWTAGWIYGWTDSKLVGCSSG